MAEWRCQLRRSRLQSLSSGEAPCLCTGGGGKGRWDQEPAREWADGKGWAPLLGLMMGTSGGGGPHCCGVGVSQSGKSGSALPALANFERLDHYVGMTFWFLRVGNLTQLETTTKHVGQTEYLCHTTFKTFFSGGFRIALFWYIQDPSPLCTPGTLVTCRFLDPEAGSRWSSLPQLQLWYSNFQ